MALGSLRLSTSSKASFNTYTNSKTQERGKQKPTGEVGDDGSSRVHSGCNFDAVLSFIERDFKISNAI